MDYIKILLMTLLPELNIIPGPCQAIPETYIHCRAFPKLSELPSRGFPETLRTPKPGFPETLPTPEPGFFRDSPNSRAGPFPILSELPNRASPETIQNSRTYNMTITPGFSRTYLILQLSVSRDSIHPTVLHKEVKYIT